MGTFFNASLPVLLRKNSNVCLFFFFFLSLNRKSYQELNLFTVLGNSSCCKWNNSEFPAKRKTLIFTMDHLFNTELTFHFVNWFWERQHFLLPGRLSCSEYHNPLNDFSAYQFFHHIHPPSRLMFIVFIWLLLFYPHTRNVSSITKHICFLC